MSKHPLLRDPADNPSVMFMGLRGAFSYVALAECLRLGMHIHCVVVPQSAKSPVPYAPIRELHPEPSISYLPLLTQFVEPSIVQIAWQRGISVLEISSLDHPTVFSELATYAPDLVCVACFNQRFPPALLSLPPLGCLNLHPSLLPKYRGPAPLFWTFRNGEDHTGVTVHLMDAGLDTGDILIQERIEIPNGIAGERLEQHCAKLGGQLLAKAAHQLHRQTAKPRSQLDEESSYYPWPAATDLRIDVSRPAQWAFNFIRGVTKLVGPVTLQVAGRSFLIREAIGCDPDGLVNEDYVLHDDVLSVQFKPGALQVSISVDPKLE